MRLVDITVVRKLPEPPNPDDLTDEQLAQVNAWLDRMAAEFFQQACGETGWSRFWIDENGKMQVESVDPLAASSGADPASVADGAKSGAGRADPPPVQPHWPFAYCGN